MTREWFLFLIETIYNGWNARQYFSCSQLLNAVIHIILGVSRSDNIYDFVLSRRASLGADRADRAADHTMNLRETRSAVRAVFLVSVGSPGGAHGMNGASRDHRWISQSWASNPDGWSVERICPLVTCLGGVSLHNFWSDWFVLEFMSANINKRFENDVFRKICASFIKDKKTIKKQ